MDVTKLTCRDIDKQYLNTFKQPPLVIECAITGAVHGKEANPNLPETPEEQAQSAYEAYLAGASMVHVHCRDRNDPSRSSSLTEDYIWVNKLIREKCPDLIINNTGGDYGLLKQHPERYGNADGHLDGKLGSIFAKPEVMSLDICPCLTHLEFKPRKGTTSNWTEEERTETIIFDDIMGITQGQAEQACREMLEFDIKPEFEITDTTGFLILQNLLDKGLVKAPYKIGLLMGAGGASYSSPRHLLNLLQYIPQECRYISIMAIGAAQWPLVAMGIAMGLNVRVGMEDNIYLEKGRLAKSNAELVEKCVSIAKMLGRRIATPAEARELMGISAEPRQY